jgi:hypothetical protein
LKMVWEVCDRKRLWPILRIFNISLEGLRNCENSKHSYRPSGRKWNLELPEYVTGTFQVLTKAYFIHYFVWETAHVSLWISWRIWQNWSIWLIEAHSYNHKSPPDRSFHNYVDSTKRR